MTGVIILAAGSSSRLGTPKQNLIFRGKTLLQNAVETASSSVCSPVIIVLGANSEIIRPTIDDKNIVIVENTNWQEGMASSVIAGMGELVTRYPDVNAVILMLCDQPFVDANLVNSLVEVYTTTSSGIVACAYNDTLGVPSLFTSDFFDKLFSLKGQEGARKLLQGYKESVVAVPFPLGSVDVDTREDYKKIAGKNKSPER